MAFKTTAKVNRCPPSSRPSEEEKKRFCAKDMRVAALISGMLIMPNGGTGIGVGVTYFFKNGCTSISYCEVNGSV